MGKGKGMAEEVYWMEDVVLALLEHFVEPFLPHCRTIQAPTLSQHQIMAKQMHAVVLLYNYYQRKRYHEQEFLDFPSFCKLAIVLKPNLMYYMKLMRQADYSKMDDFKNNLSQTEQAVLNASNVSYALDASKSVPVIDGWPISKVAVFLVNSRKDNCMLLDSSMTHGVWSVIEKDLEDADNPLESKHENEQKDVADMLIEDLEINADEARLLDLALITIQDATGINKSDLVVLESHTVYSLNKPKAAARLYLMQCTQSINDEICIPIKYLIESLQGPLVKRSSYGCMATQIVKYFHMLPYMEALLDWSSREMSSNCLLNQQLELVNLPSTDGPTVENSCEKSITRVGVNSNPDYIRKESMYNNPKMNAYSSHAVIPQGESESQNFQNSDKVYHRLKNMVPLQEGHRWTSPGVCVTKAETGNSVLKPCDAGPNSDMIGTTRCCSDPSLVQSSMQGGGFSIPDPLSRTQHHERQQATLTSGNALSQSALSTLYQQRQMLCEHRQSVEAEIMQCDKAIEAVLRGIENTDDAYMKKEEIQLNGNNGLYWLVKEKKLPENVESQCKKLDELCREKNWPLPTYRAFPYADGFLANVIVKDGRYTCEGSICPSPSEAREMAAAYMIAQIGNLGK